MQKKGGLVEVKNYDEFRDMVELTKEVPICYQESVRRN